MLRCAGDAPGGADRGLELLGSRQLAVRGTRGAGDVLVHEGAAEVVAAGLEQRAGRRKPELTHEAWMLSISPSSAIRPTAWTRTTSSQVGPGRALPWR